MGGGAGLTLPVPHAVTGSTGVFLFDTLCIWTMGACVPTLILYYKKRRWADLVSFSAKWPPGLGSFVPGSRCRIVSGTVTFCASMLMGS